MLPIRIKACSESDLRMLGDLAHNIQRVLPVTQADIDAAAALGKEWVVWKVIEVTDPLDNLRGGTQLVIKQNSILPGQNVRRVLIVSGPSGQKVIVGPGISPLLLPDAIADSLSYVKAFGGTEQRNLPDEYIERQFIYMMDGSYLLTDIVPTYDSHIEMDFATTSLIATGGSFIGIRDVNTVDNGFSLGRTSNDKYFFINGLSERATSTVAATNNTRYKFVWNNGVGTVYQGNTVLYTYTFTPNQTMTRPLVINGFNNVGTLVPSGIGIYLYSFKVWNAQGELVADYVPAVQKGTVPVVGFYDTVSGTFKTATAGTFAAGGEAVPTPDAPMDIVSNNGVLKAKHQSGLPLGYTLLEYVSFSSPAETYFDTGIHLSNNHTIGMTVNAENLKGAMGRYVSVDESFQLYDKYYRFGYYMASNSLSSYLNTKVTISYGQSGLYVGNTLIATPTTQTFTHTDTNTCLVGGYGGGSASFKGKIYNAWIKENGTLVANYIPAKNSSNVVGMYDLVSGQFYTNAGTGDFTAGDPVSDPVEIYTDGTVETIEDTIGNTATAEMLLKVGDYQDVQEILAGDVTRKVGVKVLDGTEDWAFATVAQGYYLDNAGFGAIAQTHGCLCSHFLGVDTNVTIVSSTNVIKVGTNTTGYINWDRVYIQADLTQWPNVAAFKAYLAQQYAAGTPVIVVYPLATETTESVTGQTLQVQAGDNTLEITQASMNNLQLECEYEKTV